MIALVDVDDTLAQLQREIIKFVNLHAPRSYTWDDMTYAARTGKNTEYQMLVDSFLSRPELSYRARIFPSVKPALEMLKGAGYKVHIASARKEQLHQTTIDWLSKHNIHAHVDRIHPRFSHQKSAEFKISVAKRINASVAFDDTYDIAQALATSGVKTYLLDKPWNRLETKHQNIVRVKNFKGGVLHLLNGSKNGK